MFDSRLDSVTVVIPALNECKTIVAVIQSIRPHVRQIVVVDDGSKDDTALLATSAGAKVLRNESNLGYDASVARGVNWAFAHGASAVVTCDADGQHSIAAISSVAIPVLSGQFQYSAGIRSHYNRLIEGILGLFSYLLYGTKDPFCGLRCYSASLHRTLGDFPPDMFIGLWPLAQVTKRKIGVSFVPVPVKPREDSPRFGAEFSATIKLTEAFVLSVRSLLSSSQR